MHWGRPYIGKRWVRGGRGPDEFDCLGFFMYILDKHFGIYIDPLDVDVSSARTSIDSLAHNPQRCEWFEVEIPNEGDAVLMARRNHPSHIGIWIRANGSSGVLHCSERIGVIFSSLTSLQVQGWGRLQYFRHQSRL